MFNKKLRKEKMVNGVSISVVGNPALEHDELAPSNNFANGLVMSSDQQTLFAHAMSMRRRKDALRRRVRGRNKMPEIHDGVYAKAVLDSSGNMWGASFMWDGSNWLYFDNKILWKVEST